MSRTRISTTVDARLLAGARRARVGLPVLAAEALAVNLDAVESVSVGTLVEGLVRLGDERMRRVCDALEVAVACEG